jgi:AAA+ ATPase superfamily predicted ATPase
MIMKAMINNPFVTTGYIAPEYFCDRETETAELIANIANGRNTALISERRIGKTGLVEHVFHQREIADNYHTFLIDIFPAGSLKEFVFLLSKHIFEKLKPRGQKILDNFFAAVPSLRLALKFNETGAPEFNIGLGEIRQPETSLEQIFLYLENADRRCIVAIDEFQQVAKFPEKNTEALLRTHIQRCKNTRFIFSGSIHHMMREIFFTASRPFYQSVLPMTLGPIEEQKYTDFVVKFFGEAGVSTTTGEVSFVYRLLEGYTWYMQCVFNEMYSRAEKGDEIGRFEFTDALASVVKRYEPTFQNLVVNLTERQKEVLIAIAKEDNGTEITSAGFIHKHGLQSASSVQSAVRLLTAKEMIVKNANEYIIPDRFFAIWLKVTYGTGVYLKELGATLSGL